MTDQTETNAANEPAGGVPQAVADELAQLASEVRAMEQKANRSWKTTAIAFIVLLAVIATYLNFLVYQPIKSRLDEESIVALVFAHINSMLVGAGAKALDDPTLADWAVDELRKKAPTLMKEHAQPFIEDSMKKLPEWRKKIVEEVQKKGPGTLDKGVAAAQKDLLPKARQWAVERGIEVANTHLDQLEGQMDTVVGSIIDAHIKTMKDLTPENQDVLKRAMEQSLEEQLAPTLDPMFEGITRGMDSTQDGLKDLVAKLDSGNLTHEDKLEIGLVQLTYALFQLKASTPEEGGMGLWDQLQQMIQQGSQGLGVTTVPSTPATSSRPRPMVSTAEAIQGKINALQAALASPDTPEDQKKSLQEQIDAAKQQLEALKNQPTIAPGAAGGAGSAPSALEVAKKKVEGFKESLNNPNLPAEARTRLQDELQKAQKELEALQAKQ